MTNDSIHDQRQLLEGRNSEPARRPLQLVRAGPIHFGIFADEIAVVAQWREPTPLPHAPKSVLGVVSLQGRMLTVIDLATLSTAPLSSIDSDTSQPTGAAYEHLIGLRGDEQLALAVDEVGETIEIGEVEFDPKRDAGALVLGVLHYEGLEIEILNPEEIFSASIQGRERRRRRF